MTDSHDFITTFLAEQPVPEEEIQHFQSVDWTNQWLQDSAYKLIPTFSRVLKPSGEDYFFSKTLNTPSTLTRYITICLKDLKTLDVTIPVEGAPPTHTDYKQVSVAPEKPDTVTLLALGTLGCDGHPGVLHGGVVSALLDEAMGMMMLLHNVNVAKSTVRQPLYTVNLNISYRAPIPTPGEVIVKTWLSKREPRKWTSKAQIVDKEGRVLSDGEGIFVFVKNKL